MSSADFLVEIGTEELPPKALSRLERAFADGVRQGLTDARLEFKQLASCATPRRLAVEVEGLSTEQPIRKVEKRGPPVKVAFDENGAPTKAAEAFAKNNSVSIEQLSTVETDKGSWLAVAVEEGGVKATELLPEIVAQALAQLPIPRRMRWGDSDIEFVRPVHWVVMLLGADVVPATILGHEAGRLTYGHRFHAPKGLKLKQAKDYRKQLESSGHVIPDFGERKKRIQDAVSSAAGELKGTAIVGDELLDEVTALVEWPVAITGRFSPEFLQLPPEVLIATLQDHQRYFPVQDKSGKLLDGFITISNIESKDPEQVRAGNERVVHPRLADAVFFWEQDKKNSLDSRTEALAAVVFQHGLGSLADKSARISELGSGIAAQLGADKNELQRAARLCKTDLLTAMVGEFPELQGRMGYHYALHDGESETVAVAIEEQYLPRHAGDRLPATAVGQSLALADRIDTLAGIFALGKKASGNKDPFGLRRMALGLLRTLIEGKLELNLRELIAQAVSLQAVEVKDSAQLVEQIFEFIGDRLRSYYLDGHAPDFAAGSITAEMFAAVRARQPDSPLDFQQRLQGVYEFMQHKGANSLSVANKRIANILKSVDAETLTSIDVEVFSQNEEQELFDAVNALRKQHMAALEKRDYTTALLQLAGLRDVVDSYFDKVMVMTEDPRQKDNRISQLMDLRSLFLDVADLSCIPAS